METHNWLGFENEEHEETKHGRAEYADFDEQLGLPAEEETDHAEFVRRVAEEYGFPLSNWTPTIPSRQRS